MKKHLLSFAATAGILFSTFVGSASAHENIYTVQSGDTLWKISQANKVTVADLKTWNHLTSDNLYVNQKLSLLAPHSHELFAPTYTVQKGDSLYLISVRYKLSIAQLKSLNNLTSDTIYVGQVLKVTAGGTSNPVPAPTVSKAQLVMAEAKKYIGTPYLWGGNTPAGFDCSGLTSYVFNKVGVTIPRTAATQWSGLKAVSSPNPGDLVFFETYAPGPTHVGIYLGNNQFIQAGSKGVSIADMTNSYWKPRYLGARTAF
ncbi:LysM peptidoglycan-binding domain-containing protein [Priestia megaterium]|uniref:LysM peptidoglycan-binding domain-containing protein n=1 Tax=Priestia megaterium TaxID=1404 RepID=A0A6H1P376_PRIMG|nr:C40 family peptidase [Priestia megaterium]QIZ07902.1 LysM peptidoglycan-binding domain-containing protein [Priestia megaterium]